MNTSQEKANLRGKYKKHKEGFKIAVEYKLNSKLKGLETLDNHNLYPVYVEVRAKRKRTYFPSFFLSYVASEDFERFKSDELVKAMFAFESDLIVNFVQAYYEKDDEDGDNWFKSYRHFSASKNIYYRLRRLIELKLEHQFNGEVYVKNRIIDELLYSSGDYFHNTLGLLLSTESSNSDPAIVDIINVMTTYLRITDFLSVFSHKWLSPGLRSIIHLQGSVPLSLLSTNEELRTKIQVFDRQHNTILDDIDTLVKFENSLKMFN